MNKRPSYTVAVIADIHGNAAALDAVLKDLQSQRIDSLVVAGDLVLNEPARPRAWTKFETSEFLRSTVTQTFSSLMKGIQTTARIGSGRNWCQMA